MADGDPVKHVLRKDKYSKTRGGNSRFLDIFCSACGVHIALYQKDGRGSLLRMYLDKIFAPSALAALQHRVTKKEEMSNLQCPKCYAIIGTPMLYEAESRLAFRMVRGSFIKKNSDGMYQPPSETE